MESKKKNAAYKSISEKIGQQMFRKSEMIRKHKANRMKMEGYNNDDSQDSLKQVDIDNYEKELEKEYYIDPKERKEHSDLIK